MRHIDLERIVAVGPEDSLLAIHKDTGLTHGTIKLQHITHRHAVGHLPAAHLLLRCDEVSTVPPHPGPGKTTGTSCLPSSHLLAILGHCHLLQVVVTMEGTIDSPVVRNHYLLPFGIIKIHSLCTRHITFHKTGLGKLLGLKGKGHSNAGKQKKESSFHRYYQIVSLLRDKDT